MMRGGFAPRGRIIAVTAMLVVGLAAAPAAHAQLPVMAEEPPGTTPGSGPAGGVAGVGGSGGSGGNFGQGVAGTNAGETAGAGGRGSAGTVAQNASGGGTLPFTGYPLTTLIWIVLALITLGFCVRIGTAGFRTVRRT